MSTATGSPVAKAQLPALLALTLVHFTGDFYSSFTTPLFPLFVEKIGISLTEVGFIAGMIRLLAFIVQPTVGYLSDRYVTRWFIFLGLLLNVLFIPLSGFATGFWSLLLMVSIGAAGSAMFHPSVAGMVPLYAGRNASFAISVFNTAGTFAFGVGPLFITWYAARFGLQALPCTMVFGLVVMGGLFFHVPRPTSEGFRNLGFVSSIKKSLGKAIRPIFLVWMVMWLRAVIGQSFMTFMPLHYVAQGYSVVAAGVIFSLFTVAGTFSGLFCGHLADRIGFKPIFWVTHTLMAPVLWLFLQINGPWAWAGSILAGGFVLASLPLGVSMAQVLAPTGRSMVASLMMGLAFGMGGIITPLMGRVADIYGIEMVLQATACLPLLTLPLIYFFPAVRTD